MDARKEAQQRVGDRFEARVLVPSPPAVEDPAFFADDPVNDRRPNGKPVLSPVGNADTTWDQLARDEPDLRDWCAERWLGAWRRLPDPPADAVDVRRGLHTVAEHVVSPARAAANGKIGLRYTYGGVGTPFFRVDGGDRQVRLDGSELVIDHGDREDRHPLTTLSELAATVGVRVGAEKPYTATTAPDEDAPALVHEQGAVFFGAWYGMAASVLEELRTEATDGEQPSRVQLWPEHFDLAFEIGDESAGRRAGFGCSPGDADHPLPYAYVVPWGEVPADPFWDETHFRGADLAWDTIASAEDQRATILTFFRRGRELLRMLPAR